VEDEALDGLLAAGRAQIAGDMTRDLQHRCLSLDLVDDPVHFALTVGRRHLLGHLRRQQDALLVVAGGQLEHLVDGTPLDGGV